MRSYFKEMGSPGAGGKRMGVSFWFHAPHLRHLEQERILKVFGGVQARLVAMNGLEIKKSMIYDPATLIKARIKAGRSSGVLLVTRFPSMTTSSSTQFAPA